VWAGGSNSIGLFYPFEKTGVKFIGVEAAGEGIHTHRQSATLNTGEIGVLHGTMSFVIQDKDGQIRPTHSIAPGLDYPGVGPQHSYYKATGRAKYVYITDKETLDTFSLFSKLEGIIPALESTHALAYAGKLASTLAKNKIIIVSLSGRGDKDIDIVMEKLKDKIR
jgi:tryptophan synthase beta chain